MTWSIWMGYIVRLDWAPLQRGQRTPFGHVLQGKLNRPVKVRWNIWFKVSVYQAWAIFTNISTKCGSFLGVVPVGVGGGAGDGSPLHPDPPRHCWHDHPWHSNASGNFLEICILWVILACYGGKELFLNSHISANRADKVWSQSHLWICNLKPRCFSSTINWERSDFEKLSGRGRARYRSWSWSRSWSWRCWSWRWKPTKP